MCIVWRSVCLVVLVESYEIVYRPKWSMPIYSTPCAFQAAAKLTSSFFLSLNRKAKKTQTPAHSVQHFTNIDFLSARTASKNRIWSAKKIGAGTSVFTRYFNSDRIFSVSMFYLCLNPENDHQLNTMNGKRKSGRKNTTSIR